MKKIDRSAAGKWHSLFETAVGIGGVISGDNGLIDVLLPFGREQGLTAAAEIAQRFPGARGESEDSRHAALLLTRYFAGEAVEFACRLDRGGFTSFQWAVYEQVVTIGYGEVMSYSEVAISMGSTGAARGVGGAMARNPMPVIIPCHRVIGKSGALTGYTAPGGINSKKWLLQMESN